MGVCIPILRIFNRICVRLHRNPPRADADGEHNDLCKVEGSFGGDHEDDIVGDEGDDEYEAAREYFEVEENSK